MKAGLRSAGNAGFLTCNMHHPDVGGAQHSSRLSGLLSAAECGDMSVYDAHERYPTTVECFSAQDFPERQHYFLAKRFVFAKQEGM